MDVGGAQIAGFWRRLLAFFVDCLVLGVPAAFVGNFFFDELAALGQNGRAIGFVVSLLYFSLLNSSVGGGQTIGKRLLGIRVVGASGKPIGLARAVLRTLVLALPFYLNGLELTPFVPANMPDVETLAVGAVGLLVFGFGGAIVYLFVFNRKTRQSLHDLFVESFVVRAPSEGEISARTWPAHLGVAIVLMALGVSAPAFVVPLANQLGSRETFSSLQRLQDELGRDPDIESVSATTEWTTFSSLNSGSSTTRLLVITVQLRKRVNDMQSIINRVAAKVLKLEPKILGQDVLQVVVMSGFDIGIARVSNSQSDQGTPEEWRKKLGPQPIET